MLAPRRAPPCFTTSVIVSNSFMNDSAPLATPCVFLTGSPLGRREENANPVPPPDFWIMDWAPSDLVMPSIESGTGRT